MRATSGVVCDGEGSGAIAGGGRGEGDIECARSTGSDARATGVSFGKITSDSHIGNGEWTIAGVVQSDRLLGARCANLLGREVERSGGERDDWKDAFTRENDGLRAARIACDDLKETGA